MRDWAIAVALQHRQVQRPPLLAVPQTQGRRRHHRQTPAGGFKPALILHDAAGKTLYDGTNALVGADVAVTHLASGKNGTSARVRLNASKAALLRVHLTDWSVVASGFTAPVSKAAKYTLTVDSKCPPPKPGELLSALGRQAHPPLPCPREEAQRRLQLTRAHVGSTRFAPFIGA